MTDTPPSRLPAVLGPWGLALFAVGWTIASAIYRVPSEVARYAGSVEVALAIWVFGTIAALCGALCYSELATRFPRSGGDYVYLRAGWGDAAAFLFGWTILWSTPAAAAAIARAFADYAAALVPLSKAGRSIAAASVLVLQVAIAARSTRQGAAVVGAGAIGKLLGLGVIIIAAFGFASPAPAPTAPATAPSLGDIGLALIAVIWAFDGFLGGVLIAGEVREPRRNLPRGFLAAALILGGAYLMTNLAYIRVLGFEGVAASTAVAADTMQAALGNAGRVVAAALIAASAFISVGAIVLGNSRTLFAMAEDGLFFPVFAMLGRNRTPWPAIMAIGGIGAVLTLLGGYGQLLRWAVLGLYPMTVLTLVGLVRIRRAGSAAGTYRIPWYPLPVIIWVGTIGMMIMLSLLGDPRAVLGAAGLAALGLLVYRFGFRST